MKVHQSLSVVLSVVVTLGSALLFSCATDKGSLDSAYVSEIEQWRHNRLQRLRGPLSWLSLIGRHQLNAGANSVGTRDTNDVRLPGDIPMEFGTIVIDSSGLAMYGADVRLLLEDGSEFIGGRIEISDPPYIHYGALYWTFLERAGQYYFRVWDTLSPARGELNSIPVYPVNPDWKIDVTFSPADSGATIILDDIQGEKRPNEIIGYVSGEWRDTVFTLMALDGGEEELFMIIEDATTDIETYPGGRYMYIPRADSLGKTVMDFNKAYTPPCAFTEFATCLLPPRENRLPFAVRAGERVLH